MGAKKDLARLLAIKDTWRNSQKTRGLEKPPQREYSAFPIQAFRNERRN